MNTYPDLVTRLRGLGGYIDQKVGEYAIEAADEIERLSAIVHDTYTPSTWTDLKNCPCTTCQAKLKE